MAFLFVYHRPVLVIKIDSCERLYYFTIHNFDIQSVITLLFNENLKTLTMKYILTGYFIMIASMLFSLSNSLTNNAAKKSTLQAAKCQAADSDSLINFKENNLLVAEYSNAIKDNSGGLKTVAEEKQRRELKLGVVVN